MRILFIVVMLMSIAHAQSSVTGAIKGRVVDDKLGEPLAGIFVTASSPALQHAQTAFTDGDGGFTISELPPGEYVLQFEAGDTKVERSHVIVGADRVTGVFQKFGQEVISIVDHKPPIDPTTTIKGLDYDRDYIEKMPIPGRDFTALIGAAPGAQNDGVGIAFSGSTSLENRYLVDGIDITGLTYGDVGTPVLNEFIQGVDVITGGYNAEWGRATGGIVNVVTKSGSNNFRGSIFGSITPGFLTASARTTPVNASSIDVTSNRVYSGDVGFDLGGPIIRDKLWFYVGFAPRFARTDYTRTTKRQTDCRKLQADGTLSDCNAKAAASGGNADGVPDVDPATGFFITDEVDHDVRPETSRSYSVLGKLNYAVSPDTQAMVSLIALPASSESPGLLGLPTSGIRANGLTTDLSARVTTKLFDDKTEIEAIVAWHRSTIRTGSLDSTLDSQPRQVLHDGDLGTWSALGGESQATQQACTNGGSADPYPFITNCPMSSVPYAIGGPGGLRDDTEDRRIARLAVIQRGHLAGSHELKAGFDAESDRKETARLFSGGSFIDNFVGADVVVQRWVQLAAADDTNPRFDQTCNTPDPGGGINGKKSFNCAFLSGTPGAPGTSVSGQTVNWAAYLRDSWQIRSNLTLNAGLRYEQQNLDYAAQLRGTTDPLTGEHIGDTALKLRGNFAPRLGIIYDPTNEGRSKLFATWGRFYESIPMDINDRSFGGEVSYRQTYVLGGGQPCGAVDPKIGGPNGLGCSGAATNEELIGGSGVLVAPGVQAEYLDEALFGFEYALGNDLKLGVTYQNRRLGRVIEDVSTDGAQTYIIANPGEWSADDEAKLMNRIAATDDAKEKTRLQHELTLFRGIRIFDKPVRDYNALELTLSRRFGKGLYMQGSYTYSRSEGNYPGSVSYDNGQIDPNISSQYDLIELLANRRGPLPQDRPHSIKVDGYYTWNIDPANQLTVGSRFRAISGIPRNALGAHYLYGPNESFLLPRGLLGRTDFEHAVDVHVAYARKLPHNMAAEVFVDVFNAYDSQSAFYVDDTYAPPVRRSTTMSTAGAPNNVNPISGGTYGDLIWAKSTDLNGTETATPTGRNPNFGRPTVRYAPTSTQIGFRLTF